jgi:hypothetical protein
MRKVTVKEGIYTNKRVNDVTFTLVRDITQNKYCDYFITVDGSTAELAPHSEPGVKYAQRNIRILLGKYEHDLNQLKKVKESVEYFDSTESKDVNSSDHNSSEKETTAPVVTATEKKITEFDRKTTLKVHTELKNELEAVAKKYGVHLNTGNVTYTDCEMRFKVSISRVTEAGLAETKEVRDFRKYASLHGISASTLNKKIGDWTLTGYLPRSRKFPFLAKNAKGKVYKLTAQMAKSNIETNS